MMLLIIFKMDLMRCLKRLNFKVGFFFICMMNYSRLLRFIMWYVFLIFFFLMGIRILFIVVNLMCFDLVWRFL